MLNRRTLISAGVWATALGGLAVWSKIELERWELGGTDAAGWQPMFWPFRPDVWPKGRAWFRGDVEVYVRVKPGYCGDCEEGVVTDEAVDRATDIDLLASRIAPLQPSRRVRITDLFGRSRLYGYKTLLGGERVAEGIAVNHKCDLVAAIVVGDVADEKVRKQAHLFIESNTVQVWVNQQLESR